MVNTVYAGVNRISQNGVGGVVGRRTVPRVSRAFNSIASLASWPLNPLTASGCSLWIPVTSADLTSCFGLDSKF